MSSLPKRIEEKLHGALLHNGDCMGQKEFHYLYAQMPEGFRSELVNGLVFVCEPVGLDHSTNHTQLVLVFGAYEGNTPGVQVGINPTVILGPQDEVQPDVCLRVLPEYGGQTETFFEGNGAKYIKGAPELVVEVAVSTRSIDLHLKRERYQRAGVLEYIVFCLDPIKIEWFDVERGSKIRPDENGILRSRVFPGLRIDVGSIVTHDYKKAMETIQNGIDSDEHRAFVKKLTDPYR